MDAKTYIKTMGSAKAYIQRGTQRHANEVKWDVDYNGDNADIDLDIGHNGETTHYKAVLSNEDLANLLNIPSVNEPLENRLQNDFFSGEKSLQTGTNSTHATTNANTSRPNTKKTEPAIKDYKQSSQGD